MSGPGPRLPTWASLPVVSYLGYTGHQTNVVVTAARGPTRQNLCAEVLVEVRGLDPDTATEDEKGGGMRPVRRRGESGRDDV